MRSPSGASCVARRSRRVTLLSPRVSRRVVDMLAAAAAARRSRSRRRDGILSITSGAPGQNGPVAVARWRRRAPPPRRRRRLRRHHFVVSSCDPPAPAFSTPLGPSSKKQRHNVTYAVLRKHLDITRPSMTQKVWLLDSLSDLLRCEIPYVQYHTTQRVHATWPRRTAADTRTVVGPDRRALGLSPRQSSHH